MYLEKKQRWKRKSKVSFFPVSLVASSNSPVSAPDPQLRRDTRGAHRTPHRRRPLPLTTGPRHAPPGPPLTAVSHTASSDWLYPGSGAWRAPSGAPLTAVGHTPSSDWLCPGRGSRRAPRGPALTAAVPRARAVPSTASRAKAQNGHTDPPGDPRALSRYLPAAWIEVSVRPSHLRARGTCSEQSYFAHISSC